MKPYKSLSSIPIKVEPANRPSRYQARRHLTQLAVLVSLILIPISGLFRIDLEAGAFLILGYQVWWSDYELMLGFWAMVATGAVMVYSSIGTVWCGWACPQNSLSELANRFTFRMLGKRAQITLESDRSKVAADKDKVANWLLLGLGLLTISAVLAIIPFLYLYPPSAILSMLTFRSDAQLPRFSHYLYLVFTFAIFLNLAAIRHVLCRYFCLYRIWQHIFKTRNTLHVEYAAERAQECARCNYCQATCQLELDPRDFKIYDSCINCGDCIDACGRQQAKEDRQGLLSFKFGEQRRRNNWRDNVGDLIPRIGWAGGLFTLSGLLFLHGLFTYAPFSLVAYQAGQPSTGTEYRIQIASKVATPASLKLTVTGLPEGSYSLDRQSVHLDGGSRTNIWLHVSPALRHGLYKVFIKASSGDDWTGEFRLEHLAIEH